MAAERRPKVCMRCGTDCSNSERYRDAQGRYICGTCEAAMRSSAADRSGERVSPAVLNHPGPSGQSLEDDGTIPLADEPDPEGEQASRLCTNCGVLLGANIICAACGFNTATGRMLGSDELPGEGKTCRKCGYSLAGLHTRRCPECGTFNGRRSRREHDREHSQYVSRTEYITPAVMFGIGAVITIVAQLATGEGLEEVALYLLSYAVAIPIGVAAFFFFSLTWLGFDAPLHLTALRLAGIFAVADALDAILGQACIFLPLPILFGPWIVVLIAYIGMLMEMLDLELQDAVLVGLVTYVLRIAAFAGLLYLMGVQVF